MAEDRADVTEGNLKVSEKGIALIKQFEGYERFPYSCPAGKMTIGFGHCLKAGETFPIKGVTESEATELLCKDLEDFESRVLDMVKVPLTQGQFDSLVSFIYNCGPGALQKSTLLRLLNSGNYDQAADEFCRWNRAAGKVLPGLVKRREAERTLFLSDSHSERASKESDVPSSHA